MKLGNFSLTKKEYCTQCKNHCSKSNLKCGRGRAFFGLENKGHIAFSCSKNELVKLLSDCGSIANHKSEKMIEHGADENKMFSCLTDCEKEELKKILSKLKIQWETEHNNRHK